MGLVHIRYGQDNNWRRYRKMIVEAMMPQLLNQSWQPQLEALRERILMQMYGHGMGRHSPDEICQITCADFQALSDILADKVFFMGDRPTTLDATAYGHVANTIHTPFESDIITYVKGLKNLGKHCDRMTQCCFNSTLYNSGG